MKARLVRPWILFPYKSLQSEIALTLKLLLLWLSNCRKLLIVGCSFAWCKLFILFTFVYDNKDTPVYTLEGLGAKGKISRVNEEISKLGENYLVKMATNLTFMLNWLTNDAFPFGQNCKQLARVHPIPIRWRLRNLKCSSQQQQWICVDVTSKTTQTMLLYSMESQTGMKSLKERLYEVFSLPLFLPFLHNLSKSTWC